MVKQTQKMMVVVAALLVLLLAFGLGFYTYPLVASLENSGVATNGGSGGINAGGINADETTEVAQSGSTDSTAQSADENAQEVAESLAVTAADTEQQVDEPVAVVKDIDISGVDPDDLDVFLDAWRALDQDFFGEKPATRQQIYGAIRGLLQAYDDPYTFFIEPETNEVEQGNLRGSFGGIGAHVQPSELGFVLDPIRDNPADKAGIQTGDYLVQIDDTEVTKDSPIDDVVALIRGPLETDVALGLLRPLNLDELTEESLADAETLTITVTRAEIRTPSVDWRIITGDEIPVELLLDRLRAEATGDADSSADTSESESAAESGVAEEPGSEESEDDSDSEADDAADSEEGDLPDGVTERDVEAWQEIRIGYIQHRIYSDRSPSEMRRAIEELLDEGADRFIVDLRGNPGGPVTSVVQVTDLWTDEPLIMFEEKADGEKKDFEAAVDTVVGDEPLIIVVDGGTASASEIFAGALRDHDRALILGEKTFGKGSVQVIHVLPDSSSMHITNARWFTPDGHKIDGTGLMPDIVVEPGTDSLQEAILEILDVDTE